MRRKYCLAAGILIGLLAVAAGVWGTVETLRHQVFLEMDGQVRVVTTFANHVTELLGQEEIALSDGDLLRPGPTARLQDGMRVQVVRAFPVVVKADGRVSELRTVPKTTGDVLAMAGVTVGSDDRVLPALDAVLAGPQTVEVKRVTYREETAERELPFRKETRQDPTLERGIQRSVQQGAPGLERVITRFTLEDGVEVERAEVSRQVVRQPKPSITAVGTIRLASRGGRSFRFKQALVVESTAYTHTGNKTYTGTNPGVGTVAVDPRVIPLKSELYVEGYGFGKALDIGSAIKGDRIDVFLDTEQEANRWGRRRVKVYILE